MTEQWKPVIGYEGRYEVSDAGRVRTLVSNQGREFLKPAMLGGYARVGLRLSDGRRRFWMVHHLVAMAFIGTRPNGHEVNHKNGRKDDNRSENLEYVTHLENMRHARHVLGVINGATAPSRGIDRPNAKFTDETVRQFRRMVEEGLSIRRACIHFGVALETGRQILTGRTWSHVT